ncbi:hypothetical protein ACFBZI_10660 [Moraxella sp. ZJ142]|uniref:hypothetical protein n=1 Tax=Moraxella marmotae TaxID=3344520 RepID=UPI0035D4C7F8
MNIIQMLNSLPNTGEIHIFPVTQNSSDYLCEYKDSSLILTYYYDCTVNDWSFLSAFDLSNL